MKLYNEFEVKFAMDVARCQPHLTFDEVLEELKPIELPSDEEIGQEFKFLSENWEIRQAAEHGAQWLCDKLTSGNNERK